jgi:hypothetical protein
MANTNLKTTDTQSTWVWAILAILGAVLAVVGWWRFAS